MSALEEQFALQLRALEIPFAREYRFAPPRKWRLDFIFQNAKSKLAVEIDGGEWVTGRHNRGVGITSDCTKYAEAMLLGWRILRVTGGMVKSGSALKYLERLLDA